jgi:tyrosyl-tRNA synthetase
MKYNSKFLNTLSERGFVQDCTDFDGLDNYLSDCEKTGKPGVAYIGFDCTATSLHAGSLMQIMVLRQLQNCGHKAIVLLGGGTTKIGDPSGKDETRKVLDDKAIEANKNGIRKVFDKFLKNYQMVDNDEWLSKLNMFTYLRDIGRHFSVNRMLAMDSVKNRIERDQEMSFLEFNYMILQAYDFVELAKKHSCRVQIGGSDQWGNIVNGTDLSRRMGNKEQLFGLTTPLLTTSSGAKMGKTADGAIWLDADLLKPYDYWQYWRNTADADVEKFLKLFTELSLDKIKTAMSGNINEAKKVLANEVTKLLHGEAAAKAAEETARKVFEQGGIGDDLPIHEVEKAKLDGGISIAQLFTESGLTTSNGEAKKLIQGGGARINDEKISEIGLMVNLSHLKDGNIKLSAGKKKHALVKVK